MATLKHPETGEKREIEGELPFHAVYRVEGYDEEKDESWDEERIDVGGVSWIVLDDGVDMAST
jgi:hypothetical protein